MYLEGNVIFQNAVIPVTVDLVLQFLLTKKKRSRKQVQQRARIKDKHLVYKSVEFYSSGKHLELTSPLSSLCSNVINI